MTYKQGIYSLKKFKTKGTKKSLVITQNKQGLYNSSYIFYKIIIHGLPFKATKVMDEDGNEIGMEYSDKRVQIMARKYINKLTIS